MNNWIQFYENHGVGRSAKNQTNNIKMKKILKFWIEDDNNPLTVFSV